MAVRGIPGENNASPDEQGERVVESYCLSDKGGAVV